MTTTFEQQIYFWSTTFKEEVVFIAVGFMKEVDFSGAIVEKTSSIKFNIPLFRGGVSFQNTYIHGHLYFAGGEFIDERIKGQKYGFIGKNSFLDLQNIKIVSPEMFTFMEVAFVQIGLSMLTVENLFLQPVIGLQKKIKL